MTATNASVVRSHVRVDCAKRSEFCRLTSRLPIDDVASGRGVLRSDASLDGCGHDSSLDCCIDWRIEGFGGVVAPLRRREGGSPTWRTEEERRR